MAPEPPDSSRGATSFVVVSENDLHLDRFDDVYRKIVTELSTSACPRGALVDVVDRWIGRVEESLINEGLSEDAEDFDERVEKRLGEQIESFTRQAVPADLCRALQTVFKSSSRPARATRPARSSPGCRAAPTSRARRRRRPASRVTSRAGTR